jgi:hypothetical protein
VLIELLSGFLKSVYEKALAISLKNEGLSIEAQKYRMFFSGQVVGFLKPTSLLSVWF